MAIHISKPVMAAKLVISVLIVQKEGLGRLPMLVTPANPAVNTAPFGRSDLPQAAGRLPPLQGLPHSLQAF
jgi:hypothetical protein